MLWLYSQIIKQSNRAVWQIKKCCIGYKGIITVSTISNIKIIAISKGVDRNAGKEFYHQLGKESFALPYRSSIAFYLQNLRDEAHRFAIGTHRKKRAKSMVKSRLDEIEGIGLKRKKDLLNYFGSVEAIKDASVDEISKVSGINKKTAENIYNFFHK